MMDVAGRPLIERVIERARLIPDVDCVIVATARTSIDQVLLDVAARLDVVGFAGSEDDVLDRYYNAARSVDADVIVRLTGDCPLLDPAVCHNVVERMLKGDSDYVSNVRPPTYPNGLDTEAFTMEALEKAWRESTMPSDREHVTQFIWRQPGIFRIANVSDGVDRSHMRWTIDHLEDLEFIRRVFEGLQKRGWTGRDYLEVLKVIDEDGLRDTSDRFARNESQIAAMRRDKLDYSKAMERFRS